MITHAIRHHALRRRLAIAALVLLAGCAHPAPEYLTPFGPSPYPFSAAVRVGRTLYLSGQIGTDSTGKVVAGGIEAETRQTLTNISTLLDRIGSSMDRVVSC